jgi:hypothetical protein
MKSSFPPKQNIHSLSIKDLLEARELFHTHLYNLQNVIATAIGLYRIRKNDPDVLDPSNPRPKQHSPPRTLSNSIVAPHSWPCILVFVDKWLTLDELKDNPDQVIPSFLYMPNGKKIPICVIYSTQKHTTSQSLNLNFPNELIGGGYPIFTEVQGRQYVGSIGCLVTDGDSIYALTNRHVTGEKLEHNLGREIYTIVNGERYRIGTSSHKQIGKKPFEEVYKGWVGSRIYSNIDVGLILLDDINYWTAQVFGIGEIGEPIDLSINNISLDIIDSPLRAFGAASGEMIGKIDALFYRYKSMGGFEYVSDLLIGPLKDELSNLPGNSGTLWFYDPRLEIKDSVPNGGKMNIQKGLRAHRLQPLAIEWGGHNLSDDQNEKEFNFVLASFLSNVCRELDVDLVRNWNTGYSEYWGKLGHYKIAQKACSLVSDHKLKKLLENNLKFIAFSDDDLISGEQELIDSNGFVPLADVPDIVWRNTRHARIKDEGNHFADMDEEGNGEFSGKTLFDITEDPNNVKIEIWNSFYESINLEDKRGALPFRVWQIYKEMVNYIKNAEMTKFVCAAGILSHYIGDASQPLHATKFYNGRPEHQNERGVHSSYETKMLDRFAADIIGKVNTNLQNITVNSNELGGHNAAISLIQLMRRCMQILSPLEIIEVYVQGSNTNNRLKHMFELLGNRTASCLAEGCIELASVWENAWAEGNGNQIDDNNLGTLNSIELKNLYENREFLPAYKLQENEFADILNS